jgi:hypothetical protein
MAAPLSSHQMLWPPGDSSRWIASGAFGIRSRRWDDMACFQYLFNDAWARSSAAETPQSAIFVDSACYKYVVSVFRF